MASTDTNSTSWFAYLCSRLSCLFVTSHTSFDGVSRLPGLVARLNVRGFASSSLKLVTAVTALTSNGQLTKIFPLN